jgi:two-component system sensor histidine kinase YesM
MKNLRSIWYSLNGRIFICLVISILGILIGTVFSFISSWQSANNEAYHFFQIAEDEVTARIHDYLRIYRETANRAGYSTVVQRYILSENPESVIFNFSPASEYLTAIQNAEIICGNIFVYAGNRRYLAANRSNIDDIRTIIDKRMFTDDVTISKSFFAKYTQKDGADEEVQLYYFHPVYNILWLNLSNSIICVLPCITDEITNLPSSLGYDQEGAAVLLYDGSIVSASRELLGEERNALGALSPGQGHTRIKGKNYLTVKVSLPEQYWDFIYIIPESRILVRVFSRMNNGLWVMGAVIGLLIVILILMMDSVNVSLSGIVKELQQIEYGDNLRYLSRKSGLYEIEVISQAVNGTLERLDTVFKAEQETRQKLLDAVTAQARAEFMSYRTQINPHFLFNTLECMRAMAQTHRDRDMETIISSMSRMFRYSLQADAVVPLSGELTHIRNFINVINIRYGGRYLLKTVVGDEAEKRLVLSMILQPLVENAIFHGFVHKVEGNPLVMIQAFCDPQTNFLIIRIGDNGDGLSPVELENLDKKIREHDGVAFDSEHRDALGNIFRRMKLSFGEDFEMRLKSKQGFYTVIELRIPEDPVLVLTGTK